MCIYTVKIVVASLGHLKVSPQPRCPIHLYPKTQAISSHCIPPKPQSKTPSHPPHHHSLHPPLRLHLHLPNSTSPHRPSTPSPIEDQDWALSALDGRQVKMPLHAAVWLAELTDLWANIGCVQLLLKIIHKLWKTVGRKKSHAFR